MFSQQFQKDQQAWTKTRPEYAKLLRAIKADKASAVELAALADNAGVFTGAVIELGRLRDRASAPDTKKRAAEFKKLQTELDSLTVEVEAAAKALDLSKTSRERDRIENGLYNLTEKRQKLQMALADSSVAAGCVQAATLAGVI